MFRSLRNTCFISAMLLISFNLSAGKVEKAFEALEIYDYFKAKKLFEKSLKKKQVPASYGLSIIYARNDNPFHNLDSAFKFITQAQNNYVKLEEKKKLKLLKIKVDSLGIENQRDKIDSLFYQKIQQKPSFKAYQAFIDKHLNSKLTDDAILERDRIFYEEIKLINTADAYRSFWVNFPKSVQYTEAKNKYEELLFKEQTAEKTAFSYKGFIARYGNSSPYLREAQDSLYVTSTRGKTLKEYSNFVEQYPNNPNVNEAWRNLYKLYTADYSPERIVEFRIDHPAYPFQDELDVDMKLASKDFLPFRLSGKWGFMDEEGTIMIPAKYDFVEPFSEGLALVIQAEKLGFIDKSGTVIIPIVYDDGESFLDGLAIVSKNDQFGMINRANKTVIPIMYELVSPFSNGFSLVADQEGYSYLDKKGRNHFYKNLEYATSFENGFALIEVDEKKGIINTQGYYVVPANYKWLELFDSNGICRAKNDSAYGLINRSGEVVTPFIYDKIDEFSSGLALATQGNKYGYLNTDGELKIPLKYDNTEGAFIWGKFKNGYANYSRKGKFGIIDSTGEEIVPSIFENIVNYSSKNLIQVKKRGKWGYMNQSLQLKIPYEFDENLPFQNGFAAVRKDTSWGFIDEKGKWVVEPTYKNVELLEGSEVYIVSNKGRGLLNKLLEGLLPLEYSKIESFNNDNTLLKLSQENDVFFYDKTSSKPIKPKVP